MEMLKLRVKLDVFNISIGLWRTLMHLKTMFDSYYCINIAVYWPKPTKGMVLYEVAVLQLISAWTLIFVFQSKKVSEYDHEIPQSHTAGQPTSLWGRATEHL